MHRTAQRALAVIAPFLLLTACAGSQPTTKVSAGRITGEWEGPHGEKFTFAADRTFTAGGLDSKNLASTTCPGKASEGGWAFYVSEGKGTEISDKSAESGSWIGLSFHGSAENCELDLAVVDDGKALCATDDRDAPCGLDVKFTRKS
ncbi:hypothetical protein ACWC9X_16340 [Streptomyces asoensis]|uniref:hypothetical protein n=1 Tax=Streptomyces TaxID=1883 RepID=UPI00190A131C|nr:MULTISPECIES: hypothetical protein [unclassified Streptomyces]MBK3625633.1 hypothetical protein [Streptomyces sp. MBT49]MBK3631881.1 hypothetical protein [Streptomyces sp. MBT97]